MPMKSVAPKSKSVRPKKHIAVKRNRKEVIERPSPKDNSHSLEKTGQSLEGPSNYSKRRKVQKPAQTLTRKERNLILKSQKVFAGESLVLKYLSNLECMSWLNFSNIRTGCIYLKLRCQTSSS